MEEYVRAALDYWTSMIGRTLDFIQWFAGMVISTVADSIFGGWTAVMALAGVALILFVLTRVLFHRES